MKFSPRVDAIHCYPPAFNEYSDNIILKIIQVQSTYSEGPQNPMREKRKIINQIFHKKRQKENSN